VGANNPKPEIVVSIVRIVHVAHGGAHVVLIIVERTAAQHANASACACNATAWPLLLPNLSNF
jgi:hypothetical protein